MVTTRDTNSWIRLLVIGIIAGMIAGAVMAMYAMIASVTFLGQGFFTPLYAIAVPLVGQQSLMSSMHGGAFYFVLGPAVLGLIIHMMWSALYGVIFGLIALWTHLRGLVAVIGGGPIGVELGQAFARLGSRVTIIEGLNLEAAGVTYTDKGIAVDAYLQTSTPNILAVGDVIGGYLFTHVAAYQAGVAVRNALVPIGKKKVDYHVVPWCTFTDPEVAHVGLTPEEAEQRHKQVRIVKFPWAEIDRAQAEHATTGFIKLILAGEKDEIVGAHMIGARAGELLGEISLAMQRRLRLSDILATIHVYPTMSTGIQQAAFEAYLEGAAVKNHRKIVRTLLSLRGR